MGETLWKCLVFFLALLRLCNHAYSIPWLRILKLCELQLTSYDLKYTLSALFDMLLCACFKARNNSPTTDQYSVKKFVTRTKFFRGPKLLWQYPQVIHAIAFSAGLNCLQAFKSTKLIEKTGLTINELLNSQSVPHGFGSPGVAWLYVPRPHKYSVEAKKRTHENAKRLWDNF